MPNQGIPIHQFPNTFTDLAPQDYLPASKGGQTGKITVENLQESLAIKALTGIPMVWSTSTPATDGQIAFSAPSTLLIRSTALDTSAIANLISDLPVGSLIQVSSEASSARAVYEVAIAPTLAGGNYSIGVEIDNQSGVFANGELLRLNVVRSGSPGTNGTNGISAGSPCLWATASPSANGQVQVSGGIFRLRALTRDGESIPLDNVNSGSIVRLEKEGSPGIYRTYQFTGTLSSDPTPLPAGTNYSGPVTTVNQQGALAAGDAIRVIFSRIGPNGINGVSSGVPMVASTGAVDANGEFAYASGTLTIRATSQDGVSLAPMLGNAIANTLIQFGQRDNPANYAVYLLTASLVLSGGNYSATATQALGGSAIVPGTNAQMSVSLAGAPGNNGTPGTTMGVPMVSATGAVDADGEHAYATGTLTIRATAQNGMALASLMANAIAGSTIQIVQRNDNAKYEIYTLTASMVLASGNYSALAVQVLGGSAIPAGTPTQMFIIPRGAAGAPGAPGSVSAASSLTLTPTTPPVAVAGGPQLFADSADNQIKYVEAIAQGGAVKKWGGTSPVVLYCPLADTRELIQGFNLPNTSVTFAAGVNGAMGNAALFNGSAWFVRPASFAGGNFGKSDWAFSLWAFFPTASTYYQAILSKDAYYSSRRVFLFSVLNDTSFRARLDIGAGTTVESFSGSTTLAINTWYHFALSHNSSANQWQLYVNGVLTDTFTQTTLLTGPIDLGDIALIIGSRAVDSGASAFEIPLLNGSKLQQLLKLNRQITQAEVTALYNSGNGVANPLPIFG